MEAKIGFLARSKRNANERTKKKKEKCRNITDE